MVSDHFSVSRRQKNDLTPFISIYFFRQAPTEK